MPPAELERLAFTLDRILESLRPAKPHLLEAKGLPGALATAKKRYLEDFKGLLGELQQGEIDQKEFARQARPLISDAFGKAYEIGVKRPLDDGDEEWLRRAVDAEVGHASGLAKDVFQGNVQDVAFRANNYASSLDGVAWNAKVESMPENVVIDWVLGIGTHCSSCILLSAHSPYSKFSLPTTPKAGDSECHQNCLCHLEFRFDDTQPEDGVFGIPGQLDDSLPRPTQGQSLADWLRPPEPPDGLSTPEGKDRLAVDSLQGEVNYWRRAISQIDEVADPEDFMAAVEARKAANSKLIDYLEERDLWDAPLLSVDEVITGRDISLLAERGLFELSVSGDALTETAEREVLRLIEKYDLNIGKKF